MPQFEMTYWLSQIFWMLLSFVGLYLGIQFFVFPLFQSIFTARQKKISDILSQAEILTQEIKKLEEEKKQQKWHQEKQFSERLASTQEKSLKAFKTEVEATEKKLLQSLQKKIQKMEHEEKELLKHTDLFVSKASKGEV